MVKTITLCVKGQFGDSIKYSVRPWKRTVLHIVRCITSGNPRGVEDKLGVQFKYLLGTSCNIIFIHDINSRNLAVSSYQQPIFLCFYGCVLLILHPPALTSAISRMRNRIFPCYGLKKQLLNELSRKPI